MTISNPKMIDRWFPCRAVDDSVRSPEGSGLSEKALFTWFASRPIAQARAAVLASLLPEDASLHDLVEQAVMHGDSATLDQLREVIDASYPSQGSPVVLDMFSGRGIIPLEACRLGYRTIGLDLSPIATLAGKVLCEYPMRDWSEEPDIMFNAAVGGDERLLDAEPKLVRDVRVVLAEIGRRAADAVSDYYPRGDSGEFPWGYVWATSITCDGCYRRFPLIGSLTLRHPRTKNLDPGQSFRVVASDSKWRVEIHEGAATGMPTFAAPPGRRKGKTGKCPFCEHAHSLDTVKQKGIAGDYEDVLIAVAELGGAFGKTFRLPTAGELRALADLRSRDVPPIASLPAIPNEVIPPGNGLTVRGSLYGCRTYGELMNARQSLYFVELARATRSVATDLESRGLSQEYVSALAGYGGAMLVRGLKYATRGTKLRTEGSPDGSKPNGVRTDHIFANESKVSFNLDYCEIGPGVGASTWTSLATSTIRSLSKHMHKLDRAAVPATIRQGDATALPLRDNSVDVVVTDPPYGMLVDYLDASDLFYVWLHRGLGSTHPDLFVSGRELQEKDTEAIVKQEQWEGEHRTESHYAAMMEKAFSEANRVLNPTGTMTVVFGQADPDAWRYLLVALHSAGFVVTGSWPARTETSYTGMASIRVTITLACRVGEGNRPVGIASVVENEVMEVIRERVPGWAKDGLALHDQIMAAYGPAMEVFGSYERVEKPNGSALEIDRFLELAVIAVRAAGSHPVESLPLETFDALTRFSIFWLRAHGLDLVHKGEARFYAQADNLDLNDLKGTYLHDRKKSGYVLSLDDPGTVDPNTPVIGVARAMTTAWIRGGSDATAEILADSERDADDDHLWAVITEIGHRLKPSHDTAKAVAEILRNRSGVVASLRGVSVRRRAQEAQPSLLDLNQDPQ